MLSNSEVKVVQGYLETLASLTRERLKIERRAEDVETSLRSILALHDEEDVMPYLEQLDTIVQPEGFTEAVRKVLRSTKEALSPIEVRARLPEIGFSLAGYSNPSASVHTTLKRLAKTESVEAITKDGNTRYRWAAPVGRVALLQKAEDIMGRRGKR